MHIKATGSCTGWASYCSVWESRIKQGRDFVGAQVNVLAVHYLEQTKLFLCAETSGKGRDADHPHATLHRIHWTCDQKKKSCAWRKVSKFSESWVTTDSKWPIASIVTSVQTAAPALCPGPSEGGRKETGGNRGDVHVSRCKDQRNRCMSVF